MGLISKVLGNILIFLLGILPDSPVAGWLESHNVAIVEMQEILGYVNYFVPLGAMFDVTAAWSSLMGSLFVYYSIRNRLGS